jgi:hypothetical protein
MVAAGAFCTKMSPGLPCSNAYKHQINRIIQRHHETGHGGSVMVIGWYLHASAQ